MNIWNEISTHDTFYKAEMDRRAKRSRQRYRQQNYAHVDQHPRPRSGRNLIQPIVRMLRAARTRLPAAEPAQSTLYRPR